jgi:hypothetical protein
VRFHEVPWDSMRFHEVPWGPMRFYDVPVNRSVPTEAKRGLTSYSFVGAGMNAVAWVAMSNCQAYAIGQSLMQHGLYDIYCSAQHDQCSLIIRTFWLHGVVGADLRPDSN